MKQYKINNHIITADSPTKALEIHKLLSRDSRETRDGAIEIDYSPEKKIFNIGGSHSPKLDERGVRDFYSKLGDDLRFLDKLKSQGYKETSSFISKFDSISDEDVDQLSEEEKQAIEDYKKAISGTNDPKLLELFSHILREEIEHLEELQNAKEGEFEDSVKDYSASEIKRMITTQIKNYFEHMGSKYLLSDFNEKDIISVAKELGYKLRKGETLSNGNTRYYKV